MKQIIFLFTLSFFPFASKAQNMNNLATRINEIEDRMAIKNVVDTFSILADHKDITKQVLLFTENATVTSNVNGKAGTPLAGRKQIGDAFTSFLNLFETIYHINGQQTVTLNGNKASGISYCTVTLIGTQNGKKIKTTMGVYYNDEFVKENGHWLIAQRTSNFTWQDVQPFGQQ